MDAPLTPAEQAMFAGLTEAQMARIRPHCRERTFADGACLWQAGQRDRPLFVIRSGAIEILLGSEHVVTVGTPGAFTGDVDLLAGRPPVARGCARGETRVLELSAADLRRIVQTDPDLSETFLRAFMLRRSALVAKGGRNVVLIGSAWSSGTLTLQEFLTRNSQPFAYFDVDRDASVQEMLDHFRIGPEEIPVVVCHGEHVLRQPTIEKLASCLGLNDVRDTVVHDVVVIGAGPAGLSAAVYAASEGLDVVVLEGSAPGGQAGSSSRIENYLGFPTGIPGNDLTRRALVQAEKFGATFAVARTVTGLDCDRPYRVRLGDAVLRARAVVIASGIRYRKPALANLDRLEGIGVYYAATPVEAKMCSDDEVIVVGGGNSAGQAAVFLSGISRRVTVMVRSAGLDERMSRYLVRRIEETGNIRVLTRTQITALEGDQGLERVAWRDGDGRDTAEPIRHVFMMTGADPNTAWLSDCVALDGKGFIRTGPDLDAAALAAAGWPLARAPLLFETSRPGVFAIGDVRAQSVKRVAAAVGEGGVCIQLVHRVLAEMH